VTIDLNSVRTRYIAERPLFVALATRVETQLRDRLTRGGVVCRVEARAKEVHSLLVKSIARKKTYDEIGDKAGARVVLMYPDDREQACTTIRQAFPNCVEDDRTRPSDHRQFDYSGWHFDAVIDQDGKELPCEIQLHTPGESLWASLVHDLVYKDDAAPYEHKRDAHRLRALTELFDLEATRLRKGLGELHMANERAVLRSLLKYYLPLAPRPGRTDVSLRVIEALLPKAVVTLGQGFDSSVGEFVDQKREKLTRLYSADPERAPAFLFQPESLLMFMMLDADPTSVADAWPPAYAGQLAMDLATLWGVQAVDPDELGN